MASPLPPDPYVALGVAKDATPAQIKTTYRKLALKCHPDKVTDESQKAAAADQFHRIQQAYEIIGDDDKRSRYDAQVKLAELRKDVMQRQATSGTRADVRTSAFEVPVPTPGRAAYSARGPDRVYEEKKPSKAYDSDYDYFGDTRASSRKYDEYERAAKKTSPRDEKDRAKVYDRDNKENERATRTDRRRTRDKETRRERETKRYPTVDDGSDETDDATARQKYESAKRREDERERERYMAAQSKRQRESVQQEPYEDRTRKYSDKELEARMYMDKARDGGRPAVPRTTSMRDTYVDTQRDRPAFVRRSSVRPAPKRDFSPPAPPRRERDRDRERKMSVPEADDYEELRERRDSRERRAPPTLTTAHSSPAAIKIPRDRVERAVPSRSQSLQADFDHRDPAPPSLRRSETMPMHSNTSPRRKEEYAPLKQSGLRQTEINDDTGLPTPSATPDSYAPPPGAYTSTKYRYPTADDDVEYSNGRRTVVREPSDRERDRRPARSPSPVARQGRSASARYTAPAPPPPLRTNQTYGSYGPTLNESPASYNRPSPVRREASERLYGEVPSTKPVSTKYEYATSGRDRDDRARDSARESARYRRSPDSDDVQFTKKVTPEDVRIQTGYATSGRRTNPAHRPSASRGVSYAY
ncbi:hypothetical protein MBLNU459_g3611t1 [Dothideomycetes sp. NU459]